MSEKFAVVGAGLAGLTCARELMSAGRNVVLYEKSRAPGGRIATRRSDDYASDHGAQYFTVRDPGFAERIAAAERAGFVAPWLPRWPEDTREKSEMRVGVPGMSALGRHFAGGIDVRYATRIVGIDRTRPGWRLRDEHDSIDDTYDALVLALPAPQVLALARGVPGVAERLAGVTMSPCWAVLAAFESPLDVRFDADWRPDPVLPWLARNRSKPGRTGLDAWVLHASGDWSVAHLDDEPAIVAHALLGALPGRLAAIAGESVVLPPVAALAAHRWRHARVETPLGADAYYDPGLRFGVCGDWCLDARVEAAFLSGRALGRSLLAGTGPH